MQEIVLAYQKELNVWYQGAPHAYAHAIAVCVSCQLTRVLCLAQWRRRSGRTSLSSTAVICRRACAPPSWYRSNDRCHLSTIY
jgi:hypothetical protein